MKPDQFPDDIRPHLIPEPTGEMVYRCLECGAEFAITELLYTCPHCRGLFMLEDKNAARLAERPGAFWRRLFDYRRMLNLPALSGIFRYYELIAPVIPLTDIIYLGEGHTPQVAANADLKTEVGAAFLFQERRPEPQRLLQGPGHGRGLELPQLPGEAARRRQACSPSAPPPATPPPRRRFIHPTWGRRWPRR